MNPDVHPSAPGPRKSPALAWFLSLLLPGLGQFYCGKVKRGVHTLLWFAVAAALFGTLAGSAEGKAVMFVGIGIRVALFLYAFAGVDAFFTAREINDGTDALREKNPRVAAILNVLTCGFGYFYLGEKKRGTVALVLIGALNRVVTRMDENASLALPLQAALEVLLAITAVDGFRLARAMARARLAERGHVAETIAPVGGGLPAALPVGAACVVAASYVALIVVGSSMPDDGVVKQAQASVRPAGDGSVYANPDYGVEMAIPSGWSFDQEDKDYIVEAVAMDGGCRVGLMAEGTLPFGGVQKTADDLIRQILAQNPGFKVEGQKDATLAGLEGREVRFLAQVQDMEVRQRYLLARAGSTLFALVATTAVPLEEECGPGIESIVETLKVGSGK